MSLPLVTCYYLMNGDEFISSCSDIYPLLEMSQNYPVCSIIRASLPMGIISYEQVLKEGKEVWVKDYDFPTDRLFI